METESSEKHWKADSTQTCESARKAYLQPLLTVYGSLAELTRASSGPTPEFDEFFGGTIEAS